MINTKFALERWIREHPDLKRPGDDELLAGARPINLSSGGESRPAGEQQDQLKPEIPRITNGEQSSTGDDGVKSGQDETRNALDAHTVNEPIRKESRGTNAPPAQKLTKQQKYKAKNKEKIRAQQAILMRNRRAKNKEKVS